MYHNAVGPMAATGLGAGSAMLAFTPLGLIWALLAAFAVAGAAGALLRVIPSIHRPKPLLLNRGSLPSVE